VSCTITEAMDDPRLLGAALGDPASWQTWRVILKGAFGLPLDHVERETFQRVAGDRTPPSARVPELWAVAGRRGGKSRMAALVATFLAAFVGHRGKLAPGEVGHVLVLAPSRAQAKVVHGYVSGFLAGSPILAQQVASETAEEIRLHGNVIIGIHAASFRNVRGRTLLACIFDEAAFWRDDTSASPDVEVYRAVLPALATTGGMLVGISSPYRRVGLLHQKHRDHFGKDGDVLVIQAPSSVLNPTLDLGVILRATANDPEAAKAEWEAEFRSDLSSLLADASIDAAVDHSRPAELPPREKITYRAFTDASAGRHDAFTLCIGHVEEGRFITDVIRGRHPPFDPKEVVAEYAALALAYRVRKIVGDNYAGEWTAGAFKDAGIDYERSELPRSGLYLEAIPQFARGAVSIPNHPKLIRELRLLERRTSRSGKDSVDHPQNGSDDYANSLAGALWLAAKGSRSTYAESLAAALGDESEGRWVRPLFAQPGGFGRGYY
jgi:hypothetical protein